MNGERAVLHGFDVQKRQWDVGAQDVPQRTQVKSRSLRLRVSDQPRMSLIAKLDGTAVLLHHYQATEGRFAVECGGEVYHLPAESLLDANGHGLVGPPVEVVEMESTAQKLVRARWRFIAGQTIFEEQPALQRPSATEDIYALIDDLRRFFALPPTERSAILALHCNDALRLKSSGTRAATPTSPFVEHAAERTTLRPHEILALLNKRKGYSVPKGSEDDAQRFVLVWDANSFHSDAGLGLYLLLSRLNHSCMPNAQRIPTGVGGAFRVVALRDIAPGEEITHSYIRTDMLLEPRATRQQRLAAWFPSCWCARCVGGRDDVRSFPCAAAGCADGVCVALNAGGVAPCERCGAPPAKEGAALLRVEDQIVSKYYAFERDSSTITEKGVATLLQLATRVLSARHWVRAAIADIAQDAFTQVGLRCDDRPMKERLASLSSAVSLLEEWCACWRANIGVRALCVSHKMEKAADLLTVMNRFPAAVEKYLAARTELATMAFPASQPVVVRVEQKLRTALEGGRNEKDLPT